MSQENYDFKRINQKARFDAYRPAKAVIYRAIKELVRVWGVNVEIYQQKKMGIGGHTDSSRAEFDTDNAIYTGAAFVPSVVQSQVNRGRTAMMDIFDRKSPRIFFDKKIEVPNGSLVVVRDMDRVMNYLINEKRTAISPNSEDVYQVYDLVPYNIIDKKVNAEELESASDKYKLDIDEFIVPDDYNNKNNKSTRKQSYTSTKKVKYTPISVTDSDADINS